MNNFVCSPGAVCLAIEVNFSYSAFRFYLYCNIWSIQSVKFFGIYMYMYIFIWGYK